MLKPITCNTDKTNKNKSETINDNDTKLNSGNSRSQKAETNVLLQVNNTALVERSIKTYPNYLNGLLTTDSLFNILWHLSGCEIMIARQVCKLWLQVIDDTHKLLQLRVLNTIYYPPCEEEDLQRIKKGLKLKIIFRDQELDSAKQAEDWLQYIFCNDPCYITQIDSILNNIESLYFQDIGLKNGEVIQKLLNAIFENEQKFPELKKLEFGFIKQNTFIIPKFKNLKTIIVDGAIINNLEIECVLS